MPYSDRGPHISWVSFAPSPQLSYALPYIPKLIQQVMSVKRGREFNLGPTCFFFLLSYYIHKSN
jgi:hypothetical protein